MGLSLKDVDSKLIKVFAEQIFHTGFVHADPHPGNGETVLLIHFILSCLLLGTLN